MAASTSVTQDTLIAIKLQAGNENRRFKLALKDLGPNTLPNKLRALLAVPEGKAAIFERFSDSAGSYITLDSDNISVYKQLHRAAKAKLKLRIKATIRDVTEPKAEPAPTPKINTVNLASILSAAPATAKPMASRPVPQEFRTGASGLAHAEVQLQAIRASLEAQHQVQQAQMNTFAQQTAERDLQALASAMTARLVRSNCGTQEHQRGLHMQQDVRERIAAQTAVAEAARASAETLPTTGADSSFHGPMSQFSVCCNNCNEDIPGAHWHCSICMEGDFDLCLSCVDQGHHCPIDYHFLIKRIIEHGRVINSTLETAPKKSARAENVATKEIKVESKPQNEKVVENDEKRPVPGAYTEAKEQPVPHKEEEFIHPEDMEMCRTCNACVNVFEESNFVTCLECEDYDLCIHCHVANKHGHHPGHTFTPVSDEVSLEPRAKALCAAGRQARHLAICDGCNKDISGVRHKCLNCPDWDYCSNCLVISHLIHPGHRFVPIYEPFLTPTTPQAVHYGIRCDGPLCKVKIRHDFIVGDRFKCAVCHDLDFCAGCEALPTNTHNRTHPMIKFRTQVRNVSVTTLNEKDNGEPVDTLGDRFPHTSSKSTETTPAAPSANAATQVQTVAEVKPVTVVIEEPTEAEDSGSSDPLEYQAYFEHDTVPDGTRMKPDTVFQQVWTVYNPGPYDWPAGCQLQFKGGDRMLNIDYKHPDSTSALEKAQLSEPIDHVVTAGDCAKLEMNLKSPSRPGKAISYWKLKSSDGIAFGHKLWCHIEVENNEPSVPEAVLEVKAETKELEVQEPLRESHMVFPTLETESAESSFFLAHDEVIDAALTASTEDDQLLEDLESMGVDDESSDDGFLTDEEYDIVDVASEASVATNGRP